MVVLDLTRPFYKVEFIDSESSEIKSVFSPNIFLETEKPSDDSAMKSEMYISHISVNSKIDASVNTAELEVRHPVGGVISTDVDDKIKILLGFYDQDKSTGPAYSLAFTGIVTKVKNGLEKSNISAKSSMKKIAKKKTKITFSKMMGIKDLINKFAIDLGGLELSQIGISDPQINKQPGYGISEQQPILYYIKKLARYSAYDVYMDVFDKFRAIPWDKAKLKELSGDDASWLAARGSDEAENCDTYKHEIIFDQNLLMIDFDISGDKYSGTEVVSFIPFSEKQAHTIDPVKVEYTPSNPDESKPLNRYKISHITREDAEKIAEHLYKSDAGKILGTVKLLSAPQIRVGDGVTFNGTGIEDLPFENIKFNTEGSANKITDIVFQVAEVQHKFDTVEGFVTNLKLVDLPASAGSIEEEEEPSEEEEEVPEEAEPEEEEEEEGEEEAVPEEEIPEEEEEEEEETRKTVNIVEVEDALFHHDSAVLLPSQPVGPSSEDGEEPSPETEEIAGLAVISAILNFISEHPEKQLIVAGHTDTSGNAKYNFELSSLRALSVLYILNGNKPLWVNNSDKKHKVEDYQQILKHYSKIWGWDCDPGVVNNIQGPPTRQATRNFQERYNTEFRQNISVDGIIGKQTWGAFYDCYERELGDMQDTTKESLAEKRGKIKYVSEDFMILGCGESYPIEEQNKDNYRSQINRRVEVLFFDPDEAPELSCPNPKGPYNDRVCNIENCAIYKEDAYDFEYVDVEALGKIKFELVIDINPDDPEALSDKVSLFRDDEGYSKTLMISEGVLEGTFSRRLVFTEIPPDSEEKPFSCEIERENVENGKYRLFSSIKILKL
jgi:outer membrane protein OmpA-like peptidoglycan-associated protein